MYDQIARLTIDDVTRRPAIDTPETEVNDVVIGASIGVGVILVPIVVLAVCLALTRSLEVSAAMCFFTYAQLAHYHAKRRAERRKAQLVDAFRFNQRCQDGRVPAADLPAVVDAVSHFHYRASLAEIIGIPVGAVALAAFEALRIVYPAQTVVIVMQYAVPFLLIVSAAILVASLRQLNALLIAIFNQKAPRIP